MRYLTFCRPSDATAFVTGVEVLKLYGSYRLTVIPYSRNQWRIAYHDRATGAFLGYYPSKEA
jgi:hypothetical protein